MKSQAGSSAEKVQDPPAETPKGADGQAPGSQALPSSPESPITPPQPPPAPSGAEPHAHDRPAEEQALVSPQAVQQSLAQANRLAALEGAIVRAIQFRGPATESPARLASLIPQKEGEPLDRGRLRESIKALYGTGRFHNVTLSLQQQTPTEVTLVFNTEPNFFIGFIEIQDAPRPPTENQLANAAKLELGELYRPEIIDEAERGIRRVLQEHGYYRAQITPHLQFHADTQQVDVIFKVSPGERARIGQVSISGNSGYPLEEITRIAKFRPGDELTPNRVTRALERLRNRYQKRDRLEAQVSIVERTYRPDNNTVDFAFEIDRGPVVDITVEGASLSGGRLRRLVPVFEEGAVDDDLLNEGRRNLRDYFQSQGYFDVEVNWVERMTGADERTIIYDVNRGERHRLTDLVINGNEYFNDETIRERMLIQPSSLLLSHGRFSQVMLNRDVEAIRALYQDNGFEQVNINSRAEEDVAGEHGRMRVVIEIDEGPQTLVSSVNIEGNEAFSDDELTAGMNTSPGQPYSAENVSGDRDHILSYYYNSGFSNVRLQVETVPAKDEENRVAIFFRVTEGRQTFVDNVLVSGLEFTRPRFVRRDIKVNAGDPLSQQDMLETQRSLYDMGIFNQVLIAVQNPDGAAREKNVLIQLEEAKRYTFTYGLGVEVDTGESRDPAQDTRRVSPRVSFDVTRINFLGRDHTVAFKARVSRLQQRLLLSYEAPRIFGEPNLALTFNNFYDRTRDVKTFTARRLESAAQIEHRWSLADTFLYRFTFRRVAVDDLRVSEEDLPLLSRPVRVGMPSFTFVRDTRDNPLDSSRGRFITADIGMTSRYFGSEASFGKILVQHASYHSYGNPRRPWVLARSTRIGLEHPFGDPGDRFIPLPERFFVGGGSSHRGFAINQAGPRDLQTGFPLGGAGLFLNNIEFRSPPLVLPFVQDNLSAVVFHDMGNVFARGSDMIPGVFRLRQSPRDACTDLSPGAACSFDYSSHAVGFGVRYRTPIGPVRVDFGYNLNPTDYPVREPELAIRQTRRFNFFLSIGQTF